MIRLPILLSLAFVANLTAAPIPKDAYVNGLAIGCQAYSFKEFSVFEAISKTKEAGGTTIEFYPGQKLTPDSPAGEVVSHNSSDAVTQKLLDECKRQGIFPVNYGVVAAGNAAEIHKIMEFAKTMGLYSVCTESTELVAEWEKAVKEFDIKVAFHEHGGSMSNPKYKVWNPLYIRGVVESRDPRIGACADLGHWCTSGLKPIECLRILDGHIISVHLKDKSEFGEKGVVVPAGQGVVDVAACIAELKRQKFNGHFSIEHENDWKDSVPKIKESIVFTKGEWAK
ncbi:MAG: sugar phosphate isomerase/epimerase [Luteolibacter sp.]|uniref:sugar phosphate isomerase/epimerase family protein n=1 Tax=Luteolibacter sp. TaxID=1962973 RepID=UPI0032631CB7